MIDTEDTDLAEAYPAEIKKDNYSASGEPESE